MAITCFFMYKNQWEGEGVAIKNTPWLSTISLSSYMCNLTSGSPPCMKLSHERRTLCKTIIKCVYHSIVYPHRLTFPSVLILYQDIIVSLHGVNLLIGFADRRLYCTSEDLIVSYSSPASPYCTISGMDHDFNLLINI